MQPRIHISKTQRPGLKELTLKSSEHALATYWVSPSSLIELRNGEFLFFDGAIAGKEGREVSYLKNFFSKEGNGITTLIKEAQNWDGCWAIVHMNKNNSIYCFTDPLGKKQLYYNDHGEICSSITPLSDRLRQDYIYSGAINKWGYNTDDRTPWEDVKRVMPNKIYLFIGGKLQFVRPESYYSFRWGGHQLNPKDFRNLVQSSVLSHLKMIPEETHAIGVLLSGGIDSSIIAAELINLVNKTPEYKHLTLHFYTTNNKEDEPFADLFCKRFGITTKKLGYTMEGADLVKALSINETPVDLGSMVPNQEMFRMCPESIIFSGDGPDELFGGYSRTDDYDSQQSDVFHELSFYHFPRLERAASYFGKKLICPWTSYDIVRYALSLPKALRTHKACIKEAYRGVIPDEIIDRPKLPLKNDQLRENPLGYRKALVSLFYHSQTQNHEDL